MKFMAIGVHGPIDPDIGLQVAPRSAAWLSQQIAAGSLDCAYSLEGGGRLLIANAESADDLLATLRSAPDVEREWKITRLTDAVAAINAYLASLPGDSGPPA